RVTRSCIGRRRNGARLRRDDIAVRKVQAQILVAEFGSPLPRAVGNVPEEADLRHGRESCLRQFERGGGAGSRSRGDQYVAYGQARRSAGEKILMDANGVVASANSSEKSVDDQAILPTVRKHGRRFSLIGENQRLCRTCRRGLWRAFRCWRQ